MTIAAVSPDPVSPRRLGRFDLSTPLFALLALLLCVLVLLPLFWLGYYALTNKAGSFTFANLARLFTDATIRRAFLISLAMAGCVGFFSCVVATPLAWLVARTDMPGQRLVRSLVTASFVTPPFLGAIAWAMLAAPNSGILNNIYRWVFGLDQSQALFNIYTFTGLVFAITCYSFPFVFTLVANAFDKVPSDLEEASAILGGKPGRTLWRITLPMVLPAMLAGSLVAIVHGRCRGAQITHLDGERAHELAIGRQFGARQDEVRMLQPCDDALSGDFRRPGETADALAEHAYPVVHQRARIGGGKLALRGFQMAQPAEAVQRRFPFGRRRLDGEGRQAAGVDQPAGQREAAMVEFLRKLRIGHPQVRRQDEDAVGRETGEAPAEKRAHAQAAAEPAPGLRDGQSPKMRGFAERESQPFLSVFSVIASGVSRPEQPARFPDTIL